MKKAGRVAIVPKGEFSFGAQYTRLDMVIYGDSVYVAKKDNVEILPTDEENWMFLVSSTGGNISDLAITFNEAEGRVNIENNESLSTLFGKIKKWFSDLKKIAFTGSYNDLSDVPAIPSPTKVKGNAEEEYRDGEVNLTPENIGAVDKAGDTMEGLLTLRKGQDVHTVTGVDAAYAKMLMITIKDTYVNTPLIFDFYQRSRKLSAKVSILFTSEGTLDPGLESFVYYGEEMECYITKEDSSMWGVYVKKNVGWDVISIEAFNNNTYISKRVDITFNDDQVEKVPGVPIKATLGGQVAYAQKAMQDGDGNNIVDTYATKEKMEIINANLLHIYSGFAEGYPKHNTELVKSSFNAWKMQCEQITILILEPVFIKDVSKGSYIISELDNGPNIRYALTAFNITSQERNPTGCMILNNNVTLYAGENGFKNGDRILITGCYVGKIPAID